MGFEGGPKMPNQEQKKDIGTKVAEYFEMRKIQKEAKGVNKQYEDTKIDFEEITDQLTWKVANEWNKSHDREILVKDPEIQEVLKIAEDRLEEIRKFEKDQLGLHQDSEWVKKQLGYIDLLNIKN